MSEKLTVPDSAHSGIEGHADQAPEGPQRPREMNVREFARWVWRQLTSMRTALILLLLLALAAIPGSIIPQESQDSLATTNWQKAHTTLTPIYQRLDLFDVYGSPWFGAVYILLMISLIGCIVPRLLVYARAARSQPPAAPRRLDRMPNSVSYLTSESTEEVLGRAHSLLRRRRYRIRKEGRGERPEVAAERGYLREVGNLVFHLSVIIVLVGFAVGKLFGYEGGVIVLVGDQYGFSNELTQYDDFSPGSLFQPSSMNPFSFHITHFNVQWYDSGPRAGMATGFQSHLAYQDHPGAPVTDYDLRVNHPLDIGSTELFLIGHGYAPDITVKDGTGRVVYSGPTVFLPEDQTFTSFGVVKAPFAKDAQGKPTQLGIDAMFYPYEIDLNGQPVNLKGDIGTGANRGKQSVLSFLVYRGDLGLEDGPQSIYALDTSHMTKVTNTGGRAFNLRLGQTAKLPDGLGSVTFTGIDRWNKIQISQTPFKHVALDGVVIALIGLLGSLFIRPRRVWVRAHETEDGTLVEVAVLDRSSGGDPTAVVSGLVRALQGQTPEENA